MSSQGTGSSGAQFTHTLFLEAWGQWARVGSMGGSARRGVFNEAVSLGGLSWLFTDEEMCVIDSLIASLEPQHTKVIKRVHLSRREVFDHAQTVYCNAVREFATRMEDAEDQGLIEVLFLNRNG